MQVSQIKSLLQKNSSGVEEFAICQGLHAVKHALRFKAKPEVIITRDKKQLLELAQKLCPDLVGELSGVLELQDFEELTDQQVRTGVIGVFKKPRKADLSEGGRVVLLDNPKDLNNIGAVIRVCAAVGIKDLILTGDSNPWNVRAMRAGAGLQFALNIHKLTHNQVTSLNRPLISFDERGEELNQTTKKQVPEDVILIFGSERDGISEKLKESSSSILKLPMQTGVSSLNLATSVAGALYSLK